MACYSSARLMEWHPGSTENKRRALPELGEMTSRIGGALPTLFPVVPVLCSEAYHHDLLARFCKETSLSKISMCPDLDYIDVVARQENLAVKGEPIMLQLPIVPAYSLTIHKTQAKR